MKFVGEPSLTVGGTCILFEKHSNLGCQHLTIVKLIVIHVDRQCCRNHIATLQGGGVKLCHGGTLAWCHCSCDPNRLPKLQRSHAIQFDGLWKLSVMSFWYPGKLVWDVSIDKLLLERPPEALSHDVASWVLIELFRKAIGSKRPWQTGEPLWAEVEKVLLVVMPTAVIFIFHQWRFML